ncbi:uncharacterized protein ACNLHF_004010 [Anomaloglossus baeobatrachus]|uniref:uncharacterized protein LOC142258101 n=1 Tax=Anomaloglossus baeobatrachus TaxID=238106 RepID=UPI003F4F8533
MVDTCYLMCILIVLCIRRTEGTPLRGPEKLQNGNNFKETQVAASTWEKDQLNKKTVSALREKEVILVVDTIGESEIQDIQWVKNGINFATTRLSEGVTIRDSSYDGRLGSSSDGSLIIYKFQIEDQGEYKADILMTNLKKHEIIYILKISEEEDSHRNSHAAAVVSVIIAFLVVVVGAGIAFMLWRRKKRPANAMEIPEDEARHDPEGKSDPEKEKLQLKEASSNFRDIDDETGHVFQDAKETQEESNSVHTEEP